MPRYLRCKLMAFRIARWLHIYEERHFKFLARYIKPGMKVVDGGAHLGVYTEFFGKAVGEAGVVYAFEPEPAVFECLRARFVGRRNIVCFSSALGEEQQKEGELLIPKILGVLPEPALGTLKAKGNIKSDRQTVRICSLDIFYNEEDRLDLIKLDIEGSEEDALRGAYRLLKAARPLVMFEENYIKRNLARYQSMCTEIGYTVCYLTDTLELKPCVSEESYDEINFYLVPKELEHLLVDSRG